LLETGAAESKFLVTGGVVVGGAGVLGPFDTGGARVLETLCAGVATEVGVEVAGAPDPFDTGGAGLLGAFCTGTAIEAEIGVLVSFDTGAAATEVGVGVACVLSPFDTGGADDVALEGTVLLEPFGRELAIGVGRAGVL